MGYERQAGALGLVGGTRFGAHLGSLLFGAHLGSFGSLFILILFGALLGPFWALGPIWGGALAYFGLFSTEHRASWLELSSALPRR